MDKSLNGIQVSRIWWNGANGDKSLEAENGTTLTLSITDYGYWVVECRDGIEMAQHNLAFIATVSWMIV